MVRNLDADKVKFQFCFQNFLSFCSLETAGGGGGGGAG